MGMNKKSHIGRQARRGQEGHGGHEDREDHVGGRPAGGKEA